MSGARLLTTERLSEPSDEELKEPIDYDQLLKELGYEALEETPEQARIVKDIIPDPKNSQEKIPERLKAKPNLISQNLREGDARIYVSKHDGIPGSIIEVISKEKQEDEKNKIEALALYAVVRVMCRNKRGETHDSFYPISIARYVAKDVVGPFQESLLVSKMNDSKEADLVESIDPTRHEASSEPLPFKISVKSDSETNKIESIRIRQKNKDKSGKIVGLAVYMNDEQNHGKSPEIQRTLVGWAPSSGVILSNLPPGAPSKKGKRYYVLNA